MAAGSLLDGVYGIDGFDGLESFDAFVDVRGRRDAPPVSRRRSAARRRGRESPRRQVAERSFPEFSSLIRLPTPVRRARRPHPMSVPSWWHRVCQEAFGSSLAIVVILWIQNRGLDAFGSLATAMAGLGRLSALLAADLLLVQVLLMARIPLLERSFGQDKLVRIHAVVGFSSFTLMLAHIGLTMQAYAITESVSLPLAFADATVHYPGMLLAVVGTGLIVLVVVTSMSWVRTRLRYESWHLLHVYAYAGVGLSLPHQLWTGADFIASPFARAYWWTIYLAAGGSVLYWRIGRPIWRNLGYRLRVVRVVQESPDVVSVYMRGRNLHRLGASGGQFLNWRFMNRPGWTRANPFSLSAAPQNDRLRITVKAHGGGSSRLAELRPGTRVLVEGPFGRLHPGVRSRPKVTLLASGIGITPMRALMEELDHVPGELHLIYRASTDQDLVLRDDIDELAARTGARVHYVLGRRAKGRNQTWLPEGSSQLGEAEALLRLVPDLAEHEVFICGADAWMDAAQEAVRKAGVPRRYVHMERFTW